jgi:hypothetical protein
LKNWLPTSRAKWIAFVVSVVVLGVMLRVAVESGSSYNRGLTAQEEGNAEEAVFHFRAAAQWYLPGLPTNESALDHMEAIAVEAQKECEGCPPGCGEENAMACSEKPCTQCVFALQVYDSMRSAILGTRSFYTPHATRLAHVNESLVTVMSRARESHENGPRTSEKDRDSQASFYQERLERDYAPDPLWSLLASLAFLGWIASLFLAIWRGMPSGDEIDRFAMIRWALCACGFFGLWVLSLFFL